MAAVEAEPPAELRRYIANELRWFGGHGLTSANLGRYSRLVNLPAVRAHLPATATPREVLRVLEDMLITMIMGVSEGVTLRSAGVTVVVDRLRDAWLRLLGLPPYVRGRDFEKRRMEANDRIARVSLTDWRAADGPEQEMFEVLAGYLLGTNFPEPKWLVRESRLHYVFGPDRAIKQLRCDYDAEVLGASARQFGVDHRTTAANRSGRYDLVEGSWVGGESITTDRLSDGTLALTLHLDPPRQRGELVQFGYTLTTEVGSSPHAVIRLNAQLTVWRHVLTIAFDPGAQPNRVWWLQHHVGAGPAAEPKTAEHDLTIDKDSCVIRAFDGLRFAADYGIAWRW